MSMISFICAVASLFFLLVTENILLSLVLIIAGLVLALADLIPLYRREGLMFGDFVKQAFHTNWGSMVGLLNGLFFILLIFA